MPQIHLDLPQSILNEINNRHPQSRKLSANEICNEALGVYKWAVEQTAEGYIIAAANKNRELVCQIATPNLPAVIPTKK